MADVTSLLDLEFIVSFLWGMWPLKLTLLLQERCKGKGNFPYVCLLYVNTAATDSSLKTWNIVLPPIQTVYTLVPGKAQTLNSAERRLISMTAVSKSLDHLISSD